MVNFTAERVLLTEYQQDHLELPVATITFEAVTHGLRAVIDSQNACRKQMWQTDTDLRQKYRLGEKMMELWGKEELLGALAGDIIEFEFKKMLAQKDDDDKAAKKSASENQRHYPFYGGWIDDDQLPYGD